MFNVLYHIPNKTNYGWLYFLNLFLESDFFLETFKVYYNFLELARVERITLVAFYFNVNPVNDQGIQSLKVENRL